MSRLWQATGVALILAIACMSLGGTAATATKYIDSFVGNPTSSSGTTGGLFSTASNGVGSVAVNDGTDMFYVVDRGNHRIQQFDGANGFVRAWGRDVVSAGAEQADEQQLLTVNATAGQYKLTFGADTTVDIDYDDTAGDVAAALNALSSINTGGGSVTVTGGPGGAGGANPYVVTFAGARADINQAALVVGAGTTPLTGSATVATINDGAVGFETCTSAPNCKAGVNSGAAGGDFNTPQGIAVNQATGHVYVTDGGRLRVQEFTATGQFVRMWGKDVVATGAPNNVSTTAFEVCDTTSGNFANQCKTGVGGGEAGSFASTFNGYPTVAPTGSPLDGHVLVADPANRRVQEFTSAGVFVRTFGFDVDSSGAGTGLEICTVAANCKAGVGGTSIGQFGNNEPRRVAADISGAIYTVESNTNFRVQKFAPQSGPATLTASLFAPGDLGQAPESPEATGTLSSATDIAVDQVTGRILVARGYNNSLASNLPLLNICPIPSTERRILEFTDKGIRRDTHMACAGVAPVSINITANGLGVNSDRFYYSSTNGTTLGANVQRVYRLSDLGITPAVATVNDAINVTATRADVSGSVNPNSVDNAFSPTNWKLQVSPNGVDWATVNSGTFSVGTVAQPVSGTATGLRPKTLYRVRVVTSKPFGNPDVSSAETVFMTNAVPPEVRTTVAQSVSDTTATVAARINPHSTQTSYRFEWGQDGFEHSTPLPAEGIGAGPDFVYVSQSLDGLAPGTTYQFRVVALSATEGSTVGATKTFTTTAVSNGAGAFGTRIYELVSPADKVGGTGLGTWYNGPGSHGNVGSAALEGDRFAPSAVFGGVLVDGAYSYGGDWTLADRTPAGWQNRPVFNRTGGQGEGETYRIPGLTSASDDLSLTAWTTNNTGLKIFAGQETEFGGLGVHAPVLRDWQSGKWEVVGPTGMEQLSQAGSGFPTVNVAAGGGYVAVSRRIRGLAGPGDPTHPDWTGGTADLACVQGPPVNDCDSSVYLDDVSAGLSDTFPGAGIRSLVNVCTGSGVNRTVIPSIDVGGDIGGGECPAPDPGRDARLISSRGGSVENIRPNVISADGARVFFASPSASTPNNAACAGTGASGTACPPQLYVRQRMPDGSVVTRWISRSRSTTNGDGAYGGPAIAGQDAALMSAVVFEGASSDGDKVYFRTAAPLTPDDRNGGPLVAGGVTNGSASPLSVDLYMYDFPDASGADPADGTLTRISAGPDGAGDANVSPGSSTPGGATPAGATAAVRLAAEDGSPLVYFVTAAPLPDVPAAGDGTITTPGGTPTDATSRNLYVYDGSRPEDQRWRFVARIPVQTALGSCASTGVTRGSALAAKGDVAPGIVRLTNVNCVKGTLDGSFITFLTDGRLTGDDPSTATGTGDVYGYDADSDELTRISAAQGGVGGSYVCINDSAQSSSAPEIGTRCHGDEGMGVTSRLPGVVARPPVAGDRIAFFQSAARLVPDDHNDVYDVYQWRNGELSLISTGDSDADDALYRGNDREGRNVYVTTRDRLTWQDTDAVLDVYAARVGTGIPEPSQPPLCDVLADSCHGPGAGEAPVTRLTDGAPSEGNTVSSRKTLMVARPGLQVRKRAARTGRLRVRVKTSGAGELSLTARGKLGKRKSVLARASKTVSQAGSTTIDLRLNEAARKALKQGRKLRLSIEVRQPGARSRSMTVRLARPGS